MQRQKEHSPRVRYLMALLAPIVVAGVMQLTWPFFQQAPISLYLLAVMFCSWYGGLGPGLLSVLVSFLIADYFFIEPYFSLRMPGPDDLAYMVILATAGPFISTLSELMHRARRRAELNLELIRDSEDRYRSLVLATSQVVWTADPAGNIINAVNIENAIGSDQNITGWNWVDTIHPSDRDRVVREWTEALRNQKLFEIEYRQMHVDGSPHHWLARGVPIFDAKGEARKWIGTTSDITERKHAEEALKMSEERLRLAVEGANLGTWHWDLCADQLEWSNSCLAMFGLPPSTAMSYEKFLTALHPDDRADADAAVKRALSDHSAFDMEFRAIWPNNTERWIALKGRCYYEAHGQAVRMEGVALDITERKRNEAQILNSLKEKELLVKEVHHRVKNNLQVISSLLNLQSRYIHDEQTLRIFKDSRNRVKSIALIHEQLYRLEEQAKIEFGKYVQSLADHLGESFEGFSPDVRLITEVENVLLDLDTANPCGLLINELVSNSFEHAFPGRRKGSIKIALRSALETDEKEFILTVSDDGIGLPVDFDLKNASSFGLRLVHSLADQLKGKIEIDTARGTEFKITFKAMKYRQRI